MKLSAIDQGKLQSELQFYLPIDSMLQASQLNAVVKHFDSLSARCPSLNFQQVQGMLKGFIDLVFFWEGRFYLLDYKSNWLVMTAAPIPSRRWKARWRNTAMTCNTSSTRWHSTAIWATGWLIMTMSAILAA
ncbi:Exodeoxyribonuclease V beta chain [Ewingella americana]|uniref:Exodeoxyribonuclease V beta chain n=1 Tax=Ewingella americana TaxID=41202 RepID=A0A377N895_9GAMM|nr:Exodeoxyribonuclease V beta chain [Ewingella americana]